MREDKFKPIEALFRDYLEKEAVKINADFSDVMCSTCVFYPPNDSPKHGFFDISLECTLNKADSDNADCVSLGIDVDDHDGKFKINASVSWGNPVAETVEEVFEEDVQVTQENLVIIQEKLPDLILKMRKLIQDNPNGKSSI